MSLKSTINHRATSFSDKELFFFYRDLESFRKNILNIKKENRNLNYSQFINLYFNELLKVIKESQIIDQTDFFRFMVLENLLKSKNIDSIIGDAIKQKIYNDLSKGSFCGNQTNDIKVLLQEYYDVYYNYRLSRLRQEQEKNPSNEKIHKEIDQLCKEIEKIKTGNFSIYEENQFKKHQKEFLGKLYKKCKSTIIEGLSKQLIVKLKFLHDMDCFDLYANQYNSLLEKLSLVSILKVKDSEELFKSISDKNYLSKLSVSELIALNAFWTNRLTKEVERINEVVYVLRKTEGIDSFFERTEKNLDESVVREELAEYRVMASLLTEYKLKRKSDMKNVISLKDARFAKVNVNLQDMFLEEDIQAYGEEKLKHSAESVISLNNYTQLLYDQKDMLMENIVAYFLNSNNYDNAGYIVNNDNSSSKSLIGIDLKGYNAPIMLHYHKDKLKEVVKEVRGNTYIPIYRGANDMIFTDVQRGNWWISTNLLFPLNKEQRLKLVQRLDIMSKRDSNIRFLKHIVWMMNPKKEMPRDIAQDSKIIDLESGEIQTLSNKKVLEKEK